MAGKPTAFPGAAQATDHMPDDVASRLAEIFGGFSAPEAQAPDVSDPPGSVVSIPDQAQDAVSTHANANANAHIPDWFLV